MVVRDVKCDIVLPEKATLAPCRWCSWKALTRLGCVKNSPFVGRGRRSQSARYHHVNGVPRHWVQGEDLTSKEVRRIIENEYLCHAKRGH